MEAQAEKRGKTISHVGILDLRTATEASIAEINRVEYIGTLLHSPETAYLVSRLNIEYGGISMETPAKAIMLEGKVDADYFKHLQSPVDIIVTGLLTVESDVSVADLEQGWGQIVIPHSGEIYCPARLAGAIKAKVVQRVGEILSYGDNTKFVMGKLKLTDSYLQSLNDQTELIIMGHFEAYEALSNDLLDKKIQRMVIYGRKAYREENATMLQSRIDTALGDTRTTVIPTGFAVVETSLLLDNDMLQALPNPKLYCLKPVQVAADVDADLLDQALETLMSRRILCPAALRSTLSKKIDVLNTPTRYYEGELWLVEKIQTVQRSRFNFLADQATLIVTGQLKFTPDIEPQLLADRLAKVHNFGIIGATPEQIAALQARLGTDEGMFVDSTAEAEDDAENEDRIDYAVYLKL